MRTIRIDKVMKRKFIFLLLINIVFSCIAQAQDYVKEAGIKFESSPTWKDILAKAKSENKPIFMDCYATWCGPCKYMDKNIFQKTEVGDYMNARFICVKVQLDKTATDAQDIKDWYGDAADRKKEYQIVAYPTYLFFSTDGKPIHRFSGSSNTAPEFLARVADALDSNKQYFTLISNWQQHKADSTYLLNTLIAAIGAGDNVNTKRLADNYIECLKCPITKSNINLLYSIIDSEKDRGFQLYLQHAAKIDSMMNSKDFVEENLGRIIFRQEIAPLLLKKNQSINWKKILNAIQDKYPTLTKEGLAGSLDGYFQNYISNGITVEMDKKQAQQNSWAIILNKLKVRFPGYDFGQILLGQEMKYYGSKKLWRECTEAALSYLHQYGKEMEDRGINNLCWYIIFQHSTDKNVLMEAHRYMEKVIKNTPEAGDYLDTYANLLYKAGNRKDAIILENNILNLMDKNKQDNTEFKITLEKMQKGIPTWEE